MTSPFQPLYHQFHLRQLSLKQILANERSGRADLIAGIPRDFDDFEEAIASVRERVRRGKSIPLAH